jgi:UDP-N-acetylmuramoyl-tripeptide--D-alanyl-D-alanine ligase
MATPIPLNHAAFTTRSIAEATRGRIVHGDAKSVSGVTTDSRAVVAGGAFVALRGEHSDGHAFVGNAARAGAHVVVVERGRAPADAVTDVVEVEDTLCAWGDLARAHLRAWRDASSAARVVAITGSAGKTTTKELCAAMLRTVGTCHATAGNLNNRIGLPAVALATDATARFVVLEAGMSLRGEIAALGAIAEPDVAVITNVGIAHAEGVGGSRGDVAREKGALYEALREGGVAVVNADDDAARGELARSRGARALSFGVAEDAAYRLASRTSLGLAGSRLRITRHGQSLDVDFPLLGEAAAIDFVAALAAADAACGALIAPSDLARALAEHAGVAQRGGRGAVRHLDDGTLLIDDSYNANPASVHAALRSLAEIGRAESRRTVAILGEMKELGPTAGEEHDAIGVALAELGIALVIGCGGLVDRALDRAAKSGVAVVKSASTERAAEEADARVRPGDVVLVKGSRSVGTERVIDALSASRLSRGSRGSRGGA